MFDENFNIIYLELKQSFELLIKFIFILLFAKKKTFLARYECGLSAPRGFQDSKQFQTILEY
jgi:hypothetical protein